MGYVYERLRHDKFVVAKCGQACAYELKVPESDPIDDWKVYLSTETKIRSFVILLLIVV